MEEICKKYWRVMTCADLANKTKHLELSGRSRTGAEHIRTDVTVKVPVLRLKIRLPNKSNSSNKQLPESNGKCESEYKYIIDKNGKEYDALDLAKGIVRDCEEIIKGYVR
jgi:hypothetical protein